MIRDVSIALTTSSLPAAEVTGPAGPDAHTFTDVQVGRHRLAALLGTSLVGAFDTDPGYARQLLGEVPAAFPRGRVPLFVCAECGDLDCGALTVQVDHTPDGVVWRDFAIHSLSTPDALTTTELMERAGPFRFDVDQYRTVLAPLAARRPGRR